MFFKRDRMYLVKLLGGFLFNFLKCCIVFRLFIWFLYFYEIFFNDGGCGDCFV